MSRYIHESPDWPDFFWDAAAVLQPLSETSRLQGRLLGRLENLGFDVREANLVVLTEDVFNTSAIEGEPLNRESIRSSVARRLGIEIIPPVREDRFVEGIVAVLTDATQNFRAPLTKERLFGWYAALFPTGYSGLEKITGADWRKGEMRILSGAMGQETTHFVAPESSAVPHEMDAFLAWFEGVDAIDLLLKSALAHLYFVTIHPFDDGNGRIGRALGDLLLARADNTSLRFYSLSSQIHRERRDYYRLLEETQHGTMDVTVWLLWYLGCLQRAIEASEGLLASVLRKAAVWRRLAGVPLNPRQTLMLHRLLEHWEGYLTAKKWGQITKVSPDTALRDIQELIARGVLVQNPGGGRSAHYSLVG